MINFQHFKIIIILIFLIFGLSSCEKYVYITNPDLSKVYGLWVSNVECGGFSYSCYKFEGETLNIDRNGQFQITYQQGNFVEGNFKIISQEINNLKVKFEVENGDLPIFSNDELGVLLIGNDTIIFNEGCCDRFSFRFIKKK